MMRKAAYILLISSLLASLFSCRREDLPSGDFRGDDCALRVRISGYSFDNGLAARSTVSSLTVTGIPEPAPLPAGTAAGSGAFRTQQVSAPGPVGTAARTASTIPDGAGAATEATAFPAAPAGIAPVAPAARTAATRIVENSGTATRSAPTIPAGAGAATEATAFPDGISPATPDTSSAATRIVYSGTYGEHTEFETGDFFGLFVIDDGETPVIHHFKVYCSGLDNNGQTVWSIYKNGDSEGHSSNYPMSEILAMGSKYFAYYPYNDSYAGISELDAIKAIVPDFASSLPTNQSSAYTDYDLLVASNVPDASYGEVLVSGKSVSLTFVHTMSRLHFVIPAGSVKYDYRLDGADFTPFRSATTAKGDHYDYIFKPGCDLDILIKFVSGDKLFKIESGLLAEIYSQITLAGHCYYLDKSAPKIPYGSAVDMGTSVMWSSFNLGAENDPSATSANISTLRGTVVMWGVPMDTGAYGKNAYESYNNSFVSGTKPSELPVSYNFSGDTVYDAARFYWGGKWRIPTIEEWLELFAACTYSYSANVTTLKSKITGQELKIYHAGYYDSAKASQTTIGYYWSSSANPSDLIKAYSTLISPSNSTAPRSHPTASRYTGLPVRPVYSK